jgi:diguanylate cyclase
MTTTGDLEKDSMPVFTAARRILRVAMSHLPRGQTLSEDVWRVRHRTLSWLLWGHVAGIFFYALIQDYSAVQAGGYATIIACFALLAATDSKRRKFVSAMTALGLVTSSAVLVDLSGGLIEMHFHFFVMVSILTLYQDWLPFLIAVGFVLLHHAVLGTIEPGAVYDHADAVAHPFEWALIHSTFLLAASVASVVAWKMNEEQAFRDHLTGLPNRALFQDRVSHALMRSDGREGVLAVLYIDLDGFKEVNDTLGHAAGDQLLCNVAERLRACVRPADTAARLGGDEFAILLEDVPSEAQVLIIAQRIVDSLAVPFMIGSEEEQVGGSIGVAFNHRNDTVDSILRNADVAMYSVKTSGRGRYEAFSPGMHDKVVDRVELEREMRGAITRGEFVLHYQPIYSQQSGECEGVEALVRWEHPVRGLLPPVEFIEIAETSGAIVELGAWVLKEACRQGRQWARSFPGDHLRVSVNLSPVQMLNTDIVAVVREALTTSGFDPTDLVLELTEAVMVTDTAPAAERLTSLKGLGVQLAIDDFGTGYSSLNYLRQLPFDILKIDKSFIDKITEGSTDFALVGGIVNLARTLGLTTVAEGVELQLQAIALGELGCDLAQGYLYARPMPAAKIDEMLRCGTLRTPDSEPAIAAAS